MLDRRRVSIGNYRTFRPTKYKSSTPRLHECSANKIRRSDACFCRLHPLPGNRRVKQLYLDERQKAKPNSESAAPRRRVALTRSYLNKAKRLRPRLRLKTLFGAARRVRASGANLSSQAPRSSARKQRARKACLEGSGASSPGKTWTCGGQAKNHLTIGAARQRSKRSLAPQPRFRPHSNTPLKLNTMSKAKLRRLLRNCFLVTRSHGKGGHGLCDAT